MSIMSIKYHFSSAPPTTLDFVETSRFKSKRHKTKSVLRRKIITVPASNKAEIPYINNLQFYLNREKNISLLG